MKHWRSSTVQQGCGLVSAATSCALLPHQQQHAAQLCVSNPPPQVSW